MTRYRKPSEKRPARLEPLAKLPIFLALEGKRTVVAGGGEASVWKIELLAATGASVEVFAEDPCAELIKLIATYEESAVRLWRRIWVAADLENAAIAVGNFSDDAEASAFSKTAREFHIPVNVIDRPAYCDFQFGAIVNRSPVLVAISTNGAAPVLGQAIRRRIEASLPTGLGAWANVALSFRARLAKIIPVKANRRRFWEAFVDRAFSSDRRDPQQELERLAAEIARQEPLNKNGEVVLVGAGPGDPELLTLKAVRALQSADVIVHDRLVTPGVLELARREARRIEVGKRGHGAACRQDEINDLVIGLAREGQRVVRLKGGDPSIFGRAGEEIAACKEAGIAVHVVPGVTTALAAAAALNISLTHRDHAQRVQFVTGQDRDGQLPPELDLDALSDPNATTCVYMAGRTIADLAYNLIARGLVRETPIALVANVSRPDERVERSTLDALASGVAALSMTGPVIALIGNSIGTADAKRIALAVSRTPIAA
ncbi:MAG: siroheme synthase CysG [Xanthobacteraceae bacterium]|nr:siroheme synthase CysG [Xanthobacteraceae bacterium]